MYKCLKSEFSVLQKKINNIGKKLDKYGLKWEFITLGESVESVGVYEYDHINHCLVRTKQVPVDVISYDFNMESIKLGNWTPAAVIEHGVVANVKDVCNMIYPLNGKEPLKEWSTCKSKCEHCNSTRTRNKTVMLQNANGDYKQVGTSCITEFTGIDAVDIIRLYASVYDICVKEPHLESERFTNSLYVETSLYLALCIDEIASHGYDRNITKSICHENTRQEHSPTLKAKNKAKEIIDFFSNLDPYVMETEWSFFNNIKTALMSDYSKINGFVAYAPVAYERAMESIKRKEAKVLQKKLSEWQGSVGDKITVEVEYTRCIPYEVCFNGYTYTTHYIHLFTDSKGNVYKWNTAKNIVYEINTSFFLDGTVKAHNTYDKQKQTSVIRCKVYK